MRVFIYLLSIIFTSVILYRGAISIYFFQDDFFLMSITNINKLTDFFNFFIPRSDVQFYRPLSHELFYFIGDKVLHLDTLGFHLIIFVFFILTIIIIFFLSKSFINSVKYRLVLTFFYATSAVHYNSLSWIINFSYILISVLYFLDLLITLQMKDKKVKIFLISFIYILGLLTNELVITFPVIYLLAIKLIKRKADTDRKTLVILSVVTFLYGITRLFIFKPDISSYIFVFDMSFFSSIRWFFLFFLNWAETMEDYLLSFYKISPAFYHSFLSYTVIIIASLIIFFAGFFIFPIACLYLFRRKIIVDRYVRKIIFLIAWILITLVPIIFVPSHISPHHGTISLFGFLAILLLFYEQAVKNVPNLLSFFVIMIIFLSWIVSSISTIHLQDSVHWFKRRSEITYRWINAAKKLYPMISHDSVLIINSEEKEVKVALNDGRGLQYAYGNYLLNVQFKKWNNEEYQVMVVPKTTSEPFLYKFD